MIALAKKRGITVNQRDIMPEEMSSFEGCFVVGTAAEVTPVREIAGTPYVVGDIIHDIANDYDKLVRRKLSL